MRLPDPTLSRLILIGTSTHTSESGLPDLPAVANNLTDLAAALVDLDYGLPGAPQARIIRNPENPHDLGVLVTELASEAEDLLLVYYAGHGLLDPRGNLHLALPGTRKSMLRYTAFPFDGLREAIVESPARNRVLILDCCYSGRAIDTMSDPDEPAYDQIDITGTYTLTATTATKLALAPEGAHHTAFTGELITLLRQGTPDAPDPLTLDHVYRHLHRTLTRAGLPRPQQRGTDNAAHLALARNRAHLQVTSPAARLAQRTLDAHQIGKAGDAAHAARLFDQIVLESIAVLGPDHPDTLASRNNHADWVGGAGDAKAATRLLAQIVNDRARVLGPDDTATLSSRSYLAYWTRESGNSGLAALLYERLIEDFSRVLGPDDTDTLSSRRNYACSIGEAGDARLAVRLLDALVEDHIRALGADHPDTLDARHSCANWLGYAGDTGNAAQMSDHILHDRIRVLGSDHPDTLINRNDLAHWIGVSGNAARAVHLFAVVVGENTRVLGLDHPETLNSRHHLAYWTGVVGETKQAAKLFEQVVKDQARVLGPDHPNTRKSRHNHAYWAGEAERAT